MRYPVLLLLMALFGCSQNGPTRYEVSGKVIYEGAPVPAGSISFDPDTAQGNSGPGGYAIIKNGAYRTLHDRGIVGGPHVIRVRGYKAGSLSNEPGTAHGPALFDEMTIQVELPHAPAKHDIHLGDDRPRG